jgi:DNA polymerase (family 10)
MDNITIAQQLRQHARKLDSQGENLYRVRAYRRAAQIVLGLELPVLDLLAESGSQALRSLPGIGTHLGFTIEHLARTGEFLTFEERGSARVAS